LMKRNDIASASLVIDMYADQRVKHLLANWRELFGSESVKVCKTHAKIARVWKGDVKLLLRGSMNLNFNPRFEQFDLTEGGEDFDLVEQVENELPILESGYTYQDILEASKLKRVFGADVLQRFGNLGSVVDLVRGNYGEGATAKADGS